MENDPAHAKRLKENTTKRLKFVLQAQDDVLPADDAVAPHETEAQLGDATDKQRQGTTGTRGSV